MLQSDYRLRGISLSGENPTAHLSLNYDHSSGWYAGASLAGVELEPGPLRPALIAYGGFVRRDGPTGAWELGATLSRFSGAAGYDYGEVFAGFIAERWSARVYLSPDYFGRVRTLSGELNGALPLTRELRAFAHLGALARLAGTAAAGIGPTRYDARVGLGARVMDFDIRLAWVDTSQAVRYAGTNEQRRGTWVLSASHDC